jgi:arylsulfatase A-like enzyme
MKICIQALGFTLIFFSLFSCQKKGDTSKKPNILIIYADDLGYGDLASYGGDIPTPNMDRIGKEGIRFTNFYVSAPACTPSRYSLLTGSYPQRSKHGLTNALMPVDTNYLDTAETTLADYLKSAGYRTAVFGKWHLGFENAEGMPDLHGFDEFAGFRGGCIDFFTHVYGQMGHDWYVGGKETIEKGYSTDLITNHTLHFIDQMSGDNAPFFSYLSYNAPHYGKSDPDTIVAHTVSLSEGEYQGYGIINSLQAPPEYIRKFRHIRDPYRQAYAAMVSSMDDNIGRVLDKLEEEEMLDNTIIWFISDNGGYSERYFAHADNGGLRGEKGTLWEGGIRVPALIMWKDKITAGQVIDIPLINMDVVPTLAEFIGFQDQLSPLVIDGKDISRVLLGDIHEIDRPLYWKYNKQSALRNGEWKLINNEKLYHLASDRNETKDVATENPDKVKELQDLFDQIDQQL